MLLTVVFAMKVVGVGWGVRGGWRLGVVWGHLFLYLSVGGVWRRFCGRWAGGFGEARYVEVVEGGGGVY